MPEYRNPNAGGGGSTDNRSFLVMMVVMVGVIVGLQIYRAKQNPDTASPQQPANAQAVTDTRRSGIVDHSGAQAVSVAPVHPVATVQAAGETTTVVENDLYKIAFSNRGGEVRSWILKKYKDDNGQPLDLVHTGASQAYGYPLSLYTYDPAITKALANGLFLASATGNLTAPATLTFTWASGNLSATKTFSFGSDYVIHADTQVLRDGLPIAAPLAWPAGFGDMESAQAYASATVDTSSKDKAEHLSLHKPFLGGNYVIGGNTLQGPFDYAGVTDQYFGAIFLPDHVDDATLVTLSNQIDVAQVKPDTGRHTNPLSGSSGKPVPVPVIGAALGSKNGHVQTRLFVGPKAWGLLSTTTATTGGNLRSLLDFGFWSYLSEGLFLGMRAVHTWIAPANPLPGNWSWGWAIVLFTVLINLVMLPLRVKGMQGMLKMQRIQPELDAIKAKYGNPGPTDPKAAKMNAEVMEYQKSQGVSMFGGCVPTLITLPLLFAMLTMMMRVVELRQAHFLWLKDLSAGDPWHVLPIVLALSSFLVQFYTPSPGVDPQQARMMAFTMPLFSLWMTWNYASGLALYWNVGNAIMIAQQLVMNRTAMGREMREIAAKRAAKRVGGPGTKTGSPGRTIQGKR